VGAADAGEVTNGVDASVTVGIEVEVVVQHRRLVDHTC
jgi:hypothetical protein